MKKIFIILGLTLLFSGCSYQELNDLALVSGLGIDYQDNNYIITAEILDLEKGNDSSVIKSVFYEGKGTTIPIAIRNIMKQYPKTIYLGHLELVIIGKSATNKVDEIFQYLFSSPEASTECLIIASKNTLAKDIYNIDEADENKSPTESILSTISNSEKHQGSVYKTKFEEFYSKVIDEGINPLIVTIEKTKEGYANDTILTNLAPFNNGTILENLTENQSRAYNLINNNFFDIMATIPYNNNNITIIVFNPKSKLSVKKENNEIIVNIDISAYGHISEFYDNKYTTNEKVRTELENKIKEKLKEYIEELIKYCKANNVDVLGIKNILYKHFNNEYDEYKNINIYEESNINININIDIFKHGTTIKGSGLNA